MTDGDLGDIGDATYQAGDASRQSVADLQADFARVGREAAFAEIVRRFAGMVFAVCLKVTRNAHDAEDATQATFLRLAVHLKTDRPITRMGPWLQKVAHRAALDVRRSRKRRETHERRSADGRDAKAVGAGVPASVFSKPVDASSSAGSGSTAVEPDLDELNRLLAEELASLPAKYRLPLVSLYFGGLTRAEIAAELGLKPSTVGVRIHRGKQLLAERLSHRSGVPPARLLADGMLARSITAVAVGAIAARAAEAAAGATLGHDLAAAVSTNVLSVLKGVAAATIVANARVALLALLVTAGSLAAAAKGANLRWDDLPVTRDVARAVRSLIRKVSSPGGFTIPVPQATAAAATNTGPARTSQADAQTAASSFQPKAPVSLTIDPSASVARSAPSPVRTPSLVHSQAAAAAPIAPGPSAAHPARTIAPPIPSASRSETVLPLTARHLPLTTTGDAAFDDVAWLDPLDGYAPGASLNDPGHGVRVDGRSLQIGSGRGKRGSLMMVNSDLRVASVDVGRFGTGRFTQVGGTTSALQVRLGAEAGGLGVYELSGGGLLAIGAPPAGALGGTVIGGTGVGRLRLGDADSDGTLFQTPRWSSDPPSPALQGSVVVRGGRGGEGTIRGWGGVVGVGRELVQNGRVIADGYGRDRALIFAGFASVNNTIENPASGGTNGWFARDGGRLLLPRLPVTPGTHTYTWGESADDPTIDLVNSVRLTLHDARSPGRLDVSLLATDRADAPAGPAGVPLVGLWALDTGISRPSAIDLTVRIDDARARRLGVSDNALAVWAYDGSDWSVVGEADLTSALDGYLLSGTAPPKTTYFAVGPLLGESSSAGVAAALSGHVGGIVPEPSGALAALAAAAGLCLRRRRRRRHLR